LKLMARGGLLKSLLQLNSQFKELKVETRPRRWQSTTLQC